MKMLTVYRGLLLVTLGMLALGRAASAAEPTAFHLIKEANRHVGEEAKDQVVQIRSEKSVGTLVPIIWYVVLYDPDATAKATEVKFGAGKKLSVKRPARILEPITKAHKPLNRAKLRVDSDKAIEIATKDPLLKNLTLTATRLTLERRSTDDDSPVWKVRIWAAKLRNPKDDADLGEAIISADDGKVLKSDLHINRVD